MGKVKTHGITGLSGGVKNLFGCIPGLMKPELHCQFPEKDRFGHMLVDLCQCLHPSFFLMDGVEAMEGDGPSGGTMRKVGITFAAENPYALDLALCRLMDMEEDAVPTIVAAKERGLCAVSYTHLPEKHPYQVSGPSHGDAPGQGDPGPCFQRQWPSH